MATAARILVGLLVLGIGTYGVYTCLALWSWTMWLPVKVVITIVLFVLSVLVIDNGLGLVQRVSEPVKLYTVDEHDSRQTWVFPGFNGVGPQLVDVLTDNAHEQPLHGLVSFDPPYGGYSEQAIADAFYQWWRANQPNTLNGYAESQGALIILRLLRQHPDLHIDELTLSAGISCNEDVLAPSWLLGVVGSLPGGPITTALARWKQGYDVRNSPSLAADADPVAAHAAEQASRQLTTPMVFGQMRAIAESDKPLPGSLAGRIGRVTYLRAPGTQDAFVKTRQAAATWRAAMGPDTPFEEREVPDFAPDLHTPTPERPAPAVQAISEMANL